LKLEAVMEPAEALKIIQSLADGVDPNTKAPLAERSVLQTPGVIRALVEAVRALEYLHQIQKRNMKLPANAGKEWTGAEEEQICEELKKGMSFEKIARIHGRTHTSIVARLIRLGRIQTSAANSPREANELTEETTEWPVQERVVR
jgi:hypothetical protein